MFLVVWILSILAQGKIINGIIKINELAEDATQVLPAGQTLKLICTAPFPVKWVLPNNSKYRDWSDPRGDGRNTVNGPFSSGRIILEIKDLLYTDTGSYKCAPKQESTDVQTRTLYVFVQDKNPDHSFLHRKLPAPPVTLREDESGFVKCLVTDNNLDVRLFIARKLQSQFSYDPKHGFSVPADSFSIGGKQSACRAYKSDSDVDDDFVDELQFILLVLEKVRPENTELIVNKTDAEHAFAKMKVMSLGCKLEGVGQGFQINCGWSVPPGLQSQLNRYNETHLDDDNPDATTLRVYDLRVSDSGIYKCLCTAQDVQRSESVEVLVSPTEGQVTIHSRTPMQSKVVLAQGESTKFTVEYEYWPEESPEFSQAQLPTWHHFYISPLYGVTNTTISGFSGRKSTNHQIEGNSIDGQTRIKSAILKLTNLKVEDSGTYTLMIVVKDLKFPVNFILEVQVTIPQLKSLVTDVDVDYKQIDYNFIQLSQPFQYICLAGMVGLNPDRIQVEWCSLNQPCVILATATKIGTFEIAKLAILNSSKLGGDRGIFQCTGIDWDVQNMQEVFVTDVPNAQQNRGLAIEDKHIPAANDGNASVIYEGDDYELSCVYQKHFYTHVEWKRTDIADGHEIIITAMHSEHQFSDSNVIKFDKIDTSSSAYYFCTASDVNGNSTFRKSELQVIATQLPVFTYDTFYKSEYVANYSEPFSVYCNANGVPKPRIRWMKDGKDVVPMSGLVISDDNCTVTMLTTVKEDAGQYACIVWNRVGTRYRNMTLVVEGLQESAGLSGAMKALTGIGGGILVLIVLGLLIALIYVWRREKRKDMQLRELYNSLRMSRRISKKDRKQRKGEESVQLPIRLDPKRPLNNQIDILGYDRKYEIERSWLKLDEIIGEGQFGKVHKGTLVRPDPNVPTWRKRISGAGMLEPIPVAVKIPKDGRNHQHQKSLLDELKIMVHLGAHPNVLGLVAAVTKLITKGELYVVVDFCAQGSLLNFLKRNRATFVSEISHCETHVPVTNEGYLAPDHLNLGPQQKTVYQGDIQDDWESDLFESRLTREFLTTSDLISWAYQISNGMEFLAANYLIHRDLAARNILLTDNLVVKIADFGLARQNQQYHIAASRNVPLPIKWMALESIVDYDYTVKSDVWSFGVVMWELFSLAKEPYPTQPLDQSFIQFLKEGNRLLKPEHSPVEIYELMFSCWMEHPDDRPTFGQVTQQLGQELKRVSDSMHRWTLRECHREPTHSYVNVRENNLTEEVVEDDFDNEFTEDDVELHSFDTFVKPPQGAIDNQLYMSRNSFVPEPHYV